MGNGARPRGRKAGEAWGWPLN